MISDFAQNIQRRVGVVLAALCTLWVPLVAPAEIAQMRSGEHGAFTRLVVELERPSAWRLGRVEGGYALQFDRSDIAIETADLFTRITRDRVRDVTEQEGGGLMIATDCPCYINAFEMRPGLVVMDMRDGPAPADSPFEVPMTQMTEQMAPTVDPIDTPPAADALVVAAPPADIPQTQTPRLRGMGQDQSGLLALYWRQALASRPNDSDDLVVSERLDGGVPEPQIDKQDHVTVPHDTVHSAADAMHAPSVTSSPTGQNEERVDEARDHLVNQIARAASQGLLEIDLPSVEPVHHAEPVVISAPPTKAPTPAPKLPTDHMSIRAKTSIDRDYTREYPERPLTPDGKECLLQKTVNIAAWGTNDPPNQQLSAARASLITELDTPEPQAVQTLARLYIYFGFGAEARQLIRNFPENLPDSDVLETLSEIVENGVAQDPGRLGGMMSCNSAVALWAAMALPKLEATDVIENGAVLRAFSALPVHLRRHLGPTLIERFLAMGDEQTARSLRDAVLRAPGNTGARFQVVDAKLSIATGEDMQAADRLLDIIAQDGSGAGEALAFYLENMLERGTAIDPRLIESVAAMAQERRGTETGAALARAYILALASTGAFDQAFETRDRLTRLGPNTTPAPLNDALFQFLAEKAPDDTFARHVLAQADNLTRAPLSPPVRRALAQRLLDLGFGAETLKMLADIPPENDDDQILLARAALGARDPAGALAALSGLLGADAERVRAAALLALNDPMTAAEAFGRAGANEQQASAAWQAGDLAVMATNGAADKAAAVAELGASGAGSSLADVGAETAAGPLAQARDLLRESAERRAALDALLSAFPAEAPQ